MKKKYDLSDPRSVSMNPGHSLHDSDYQEDGGLLIHLTVTGKCYARCMGCVNSDVTHGRAEPRNCLEIGDDTEPERDVRIILQLMQRHFGRFFTLCFYGGEPFLEMDKMVEVWRLIKQSPVSGRIRFFVYTNGEYLAEALERHPRFMEDLWVCSVSIDGREKQHNRVRRGTRLARIVDNLRVFRKELSGNVLYWSTLRESQSLWDCFEGFLELKTDNLVDHMFWHWAEGREPFTNFDAFQDDYLRDLERVLDCYVSELSAGRQLSLIHVNELVLYLLTGKERGHTACAVELAQNYDVSSGQVFPCADLPEGHAIGSLDSSGRLKLEEEDLTSLVAYKPRLGCYTCGVHAYCGGRCPVQIAAGSWERVLQHCRLMRGHVKLVQERIGDIRGAIEKNGISLQDIYDRSAFLAKYTDVVP